MIASIYKGLTKHSLSFSNEKQALVMIVTDIFLGTFCLPIIIICRLVFNIICFLVVLLGFVAHLVRTNIKKEACFYCDFYAKTSCLKQRMSHLSYFSPSILLGVIPGVVPSVCFYLLYSDRKENMNYNTILARTVINWP